MWVIKALAAVAFIGLAFVAGWVTNGIRNQDNLVRTRVVNELSEPLQTFTVRYVTCGVETKITSGTLPAGKSRIVRFPVCGEGSYLVEATLANGSIVNGTEGYVESGYSTEDKFTILGVESTRSSYAL